MCPSSLQAHLVHFHGSATRTHHAVVPSLLLTEGVVFLAKAAGAHWLTDAIASYVHDPRVREEEFQVWRLAVDANTRTGVITMTDGNSDEAIVTQGLDYTDFPLPEIMVWLVREGARWIMRSLRNWGCGTLYDNKNSVISKFQNFGNHIMRLLPQDA
jgi:hypothetical protein